MPSTRYRVVGNVTDRPVPIDADGRQIDGRSFAAVLLTDEVKAGQTRGELVEVNRPTGDGVELHPDAAAAFAAADELNAADEPAELAEAAEDLGATPTPAAKRAAERARK